MFEIIIDSSLDDDAKCEAINKAIKEEASTNPKALTKTYLGQSLLHYAVTSRLPKVSILLLQLGCSIEAEDYDKKTPLHYAAEYGHEEFIFLLGYHQCNFNAVDKNLESALHIAIRNNHHLCVKNLLIASKFTIDKTLKNKDNQTAEALLREKTNIKVQSDLGKAFSTVPDLFKRTPLHRAVINNLPALVKQHLMLGAPVNEQDSDGQAALHFAALCGHVPILLMLCYHEQINMDLTGRGGNTALHYSIEAGHPDCAKTLVSATKPASKNIANDENLAPIDLIKKLQDKELIYEFQKALLRTQISNGLTEEYEKELFTFEQVLPGNYLTYLKEHLKELASSVKITEEEKSSPRQSSDGHFKLFGKKSSPRKQNSELSTSLTNTESTLSDKEFKDEESFSRTLRGKSSASSPRKKISILNTGHVSSDDEESPRLILRRKSSASGPPKKLNLSNTELSTDKEIKNEESARTLLRRKSSSSPRSNIVTLSRTETVITEKEGAEEASIRPVYRGKRTIRDKFEPQATEFSINDKEIIGGEELLKEGDVNAVVGMIELAQEKKALIFVMRLLKKFIEKQHHTNDCSFLLLVFAKLEPKLVVEQQHFDEQCTHIRKLLHKKLLFDGLKRGCSPNEFNQVTEEQILSISTHTETIKTLQVLTEMCSGKAVINTNETIVTCLGLMDFIAPEAIIALLIRLHPFFNTTQKLQSNYVVFTLMTLHDYYGYDVKSEPLATQIQSYSRHCCEEMVMLCINDYLQTMLTFKTNSLHAVMKQIRSLLTKTIGIKKDSIIEKIDELVKQNSIHLKSKELLSLVNYITKEFNTINALFYQNVPLKEFGQKCWETDNDNYAHTALSQYARLVNQMMVFIKATICAYQTPQQQARVITLFILVARESLHCQYGPDCMTPMAIATALQLFDVSSLKEAFLLLDSHIRGILNSLIKFSTPLANYNHYRQLLVSSPYALPSISVIFRDKPHLYEPPPKNPQDKSQDNSSKHPYAKVRELGQLHKSLIVIKKNLHHLFLDSQSDLLEQIQKTNMQGYEDTPKFNVSLTSEPISRKQTRLSLFSSSNSLSNLDRASSITEQSHQDETIRSTSIELQGRKGP